MSLNEPQSKIGKVKKARGYSCLYPGAMLHVFLAGSRPQAASMSTPGDSGHRPKIPPPKAAPKFSAQWRSVYS